MQDGNLPFGTEVIEYKRDVALEVEGVDCYVNPFEQFLHIALVDECVMVLDIGLRVYPQKSPAKTFRLGFADIALYIILSVEIGQLHSVAVHNHNILETEAQGALGNYAADAGPAE